MMGYPLPLRSEFFVYQWTTPDSWRPLQAFRSWLHPPRDAMIDVCKHLQKRQWIRSYLPWIKSVYLCDAVSFNTYQANDPITFFIITKKHQLWLWISIFTLMKLIVSLITKIAWNKRFWHLSACVDEDHQDFSPLLFTHTDPYLVYRLAHLVPYYHESFTLQDACIEKNTWLTYYLPNYPLRQTIFLPLETMIWSSRVKRVRSKLFATWFFMLVNMMIYSAVLMRWKINKKDRANLKKKQTMWYYITNIDKRKRFALQWDLAKKVS